MRLLVVDNGAGGTSIETLSTGNGERTIVAFLPPTMGMVFLLLVNVCEGDVVDVPSIDKALFSGSE